MRIKLDGHNPNDTDLILITNDIKTCQDCIDNVEKSNQYSLKPLDVVRLTDSRLCKFHKNMYKDYLRYRK